MCFPRDMCAPEHISLVICVSWVGKHKTLKLGTQAFKWDNNIKNKMAIGCVEIPAGSVVVVGERIHKYYYKGAVG